MTKLYRIVGVKQGSSALPAFNLRGNKGKADETFALPLQNRVNRWADPAILNLEDCLDALIDYRGKTPEKTTAGIPLVTAKVIKGGRIETPSEFIAAEDYDAWMRRGIPKKGDVVMTTEAPLGEVAQLGSEKIALAQRVLRPKAPLPDYFGYLLCRHPVFRDYAIQSMSGTSGRQRIQNDVLGRYLLALPNNDVATAFTEVVQSIQKRIAGNHKTAQTLTTLRDTLLPRLISGQLRLPDAEALFGEV